MSKNNKIIVNLTIVPTLKSYIDMAFYIYQFNIQHTIILFVSIERNVFRLQMNLFLFNFY